MTKPPYKAKANISPLHTAHLIQQILSHPKLSKVYQDLVQNDWEVFVVSQQRGRCYCREKVITIPLWVYNSEYKDYWVYYVAHEFAHCYNPWDGHGQKFMSKFKSICPIEVQHYELDYKPQNAAAAGITQKQVQKEKSLSTPNWEDLL